MKNIIDNNLSQIWFNVQKMERKERKKVIKNIIKSSRCKGSFVDYDAKYFLAKMIDHSECYFNGLGYYTKVKEFEKLGWYNEHNQLDFNKIML